MTYIEEIQLLIEKSVTLEWLRDKNYDFINHKLYDKEKNIILEVKIDESEIIDNEGNLIGFEKIELKSLQYNFADFCWLEYDAIDLYFLDEYDRDSYPKNLLFLSDEIDLIIKNKIPIDSITQSYNLINHAIRAIEDALYEFKKTITDPEMIETIDLLNIKLAGSIRVTFKDLFELEKISTSNIDSLDFNLNKSQLTGLIALLIKGDLIELRKGISGFHSKYDFFEKYFRWKDDKGNKNKMTGLKGDLNKVFSKKDANKRSAGYLQVFDIIEDACNNL